MPRCLQLEDGSIPNFDELPPQIRARPCESINHKSLVFCLGLLHTLSLSSWDCTAGCGTLVTGHPPAEIGPSGYTPHPPPCRRGERLPHLPLAGLDFGPPRVPMACRRFGLLLGPLLLGIHLFGRLMKIGGRLGSML